MCKSRKNFVRVQNSVWVKCIFDRFHDVDHLGSLATLQVAWLLKPNTVLCADTALHLCGIIHHEGIDDLVNSVLEVFVRVALESDVQVQVAVANMSVPNG